MEISAGLEQLIREEISNETFLDSILFSFRFESKDRLALLEYLNLEGEINKNVVELMYNLAECVDLLPANFRDKFIEKAINLPKAEISSDQKLKFCDATVRLSTRRGVAINSLSKIEADLRWEAEVEYAREYTMKHQFS